MRMKWTGQRCDVDSCYLCEIGTEGLVVPFRGREILVCADCALGAILAHPRLARLRELDRERTRV